MLTIKSREDISTLFSQGKRIHTPYVTLIVLPTKQHDHTGRAAFIAGKKLGNAVWRNKAKRRMRALCHDCGGPWDNLDVIFLAKAALTETSYSKVFNACEKAVKRLNVE